MPTPHSPTLTYTVRSLPASADQPQITVKRDRQRARPLEMPPSTLPAESPAAQIATAILSHYFQVHESEPPDHAAALAAKHRTAISRLLSARLARNAAGSVTLSDAEIASHVLARIISPPTDHWVARYSVESSNGDTRYTVAQKDDGSWGCNCWIWKKTRSDCKHIQAVRANPAWFPYQPTR